MKDYSNYHNTDLNAKLSHDGLLLLEKSLSGFEGYDVTINNTVQSRILIYQKYDADSQTKKVVGRIEDIDIGNLIKQGDLNWLVVTFPKDNKIYRKAEIQLCNSTFPLISNKTRNLLGVDNEGRPAYFFEETVIQEPCIADTSFPQVNDNAKIVLPEGKLFVTIKYQTGENLKVNETFKMYGNTYKITNFDYTKVINGKGILVIHAEQVQEKAVT